MGVLVLVRKNARRYVYSIEFFQILNILSAAYAGEIVITEGRLQVAPDACPKGIKCLTNTTFVFCEDNNIFIAYGKQIMACEGGRLYCDENDPYNGFVRCARVKSLLNVCLSVACINVSMTI
jgi:hypothetical protein